MKNLKKEEGSQRSINGSKKKSNINKQIDKLMSRIGQANENIKQTQKLLDVDLFLKQQKKKKIEYAKNIEAEFEAQKKIREQKLYKKHNRDKNETKNEGKKIQFKGLNIPVMEPLSILKFYRNDVQKAQWVKQGHHYKISEFTHEGIRESEEILFKNWYRNQGQKVKYDGQTEQKHYKWKNIKKVVENNSQLQILPISIEQNSLIPTDQQSENLLSSLCLMTKDISQRIFSHNQYLFLAQLHSPCKQLTVVTDKQILVRQFVHKDVNLGSRCHNPDVMWPTLIQKCFKKLRMYSGLDKKCSSLLETIQSTYGIDAELIPITNKNYIKQNIAQILGHLIQDSRVGFVSIGNKNKNVYDGRIYLLEQVKEQPIKQNGKATNQMEVKYKIKNPWKGMLIDGQNINKFNILELLSLFNCIVVLADYPKTWSCLRINCSYFSNGPVGMTNNDWTKNPQYLFSISKACHMRIFLRRSSPSLEQKNKNGDDIYGFLLFQNKEADNKIQCMKMEALITKTVSTSLHEASYSCELKKGNYILIPYSAEQSERSYQFFTLDFFIENENYIEFGKARIHDWNYIAKNHRLNTDEKVIQSLEGKQKFEKPKIQKLLIRPITQNKKITQKILTNIPLNLYQKASLSHFFMPGFIHNLLINKSVNVELKRGKEVKITKNEETDKEEQAENLSILLGYDTYNDEINQGKVRDIMDQSDGIFQFQNFGLGQQGLTAILEAISLSPQIIKLDLRDNQLYVTDNHNQGFRNSIFMLLLRKRKSDIITVFGCFAKQFQFSREESPLRSKINIPKCHNHWGWVQIIMK